MRAVALCAALVLGGCDFDKPAPPPPHDPPTPWSIERDASTGGIWRFNRETGGSSVTVGAGRTLSRMSLMFSVPTRQRREPS